MSYLFYEDDEDTIKPDVYLVINDRTVDLVRLILVLCFINYSDLTEVDRLVQVFVPESELQLVLLAIVNEFLSLAQDSESYINQPLYWDGSRLRFNSVFSSWEIDPLVRKCGAIVVKKNTDRLRSMSLEWDGSDELLSLFNASTCVCELIDMTKDDQ